MPKLQVESVRQYAPDVVLWLSSWETADRVVDGQQYTMDSQAGIDMTMQQIDAAVSRYTSDGARVVFLTIAPTLPTLEYGSPTAEATKRVLLLDRLLRSYAYTHPTTTSVVDLADKLCPGGHDCPQIIDGVDVRQGDGRHYSAAGAAWVAPWILDQIAAS